MDIMNLNILSTNKDSTFQEDLEDAISIEQSILIAGRLPASPEKMVISVISKNPLTFQAGLAASGLNKNPNDGSWQKNPEPIKLKNYIGRKFSTCRSISKTYTKPSLKAQKCHGKTPPRPLKRPVFVGKQRASHRLKPNRGLVPDWVHGFGRRHVGNRWGPSNCHLSFAGWGGLSLDPTTIFVGIF